MDDTAVDKFRAHFAALREVLDGAYARWLKSRAASAGREMPAAMVAASLATVAHRIQGTDHEFREASLGLFRAMVFRDDVMIRRQTKALLGARIRCSAAQASAS